MTRKTIQNALAGGIDIVRNGQRKFLIDFLFALAFKMTFIAALEEDTRLSTLAVIIILGHLTIEPFIAATVCLLPRRVLWISQLQTK